MAETEISLTEAPQLRILEFDELVKYGPVKCTPALAVQGAWMDKKGNCAFSWTASSDAYEDVRCVYWEGVKLWNSSTQREISARPALPPSVASKICPSNARAGMFFESPYEGISKDYPVGGEIADDILRNLGK